MTAADNAKDALEVKETQFAWLVYIMAVFVGN